MSVFRQSRHPLVRWWWEMDRPLFILLLCLIVFGALTISTASIAVAKTYSVSPYYFAVKQYIFLLISLVTMVGLTMFRPRGVQRLGWLLFLVALGGIVLTLFLGQEVKGASRWIVLGGITLQPSELMKPALVVMTASLLAKKDAAARQRGFFASILVMGLVALPLLKQPDFGMFLLLGMVWFSQVFLSGISLFWLAPLVIVGFSTIIGAYVTFDHVRSRFDRFLNPEGADTYQVDQAREAILTGHLFGRGAGEGVVKHSLPDAHTDFIFAVVAEEFGIIFCLLLLGIYVAIVVRGYFQMFQREDRFIFLTCGGLLTLLALQVMVNISVALNVIPTTGMTLPFISLRGFWHVGDGD